MLKSSRQNEEDEQNKRAKQTPSPKPILFLAAVTLAASAAVNATSLWSILDDYGFKQPAQKQALEFLLTKAGIKDAEKILKADLKTPEEILTNITWLVEQTQRHFTIRTGAQERWEVAATEWMKKPEDQQAILAALETLGLTTEVPPTLKHRDLIVIFGARNSIMKLRLKYAGDLFAKGKLDADKLVLLAGERYVTVDEKGESIDGSATELTAIAAAAHKELKMLTETDLIVDSYNKSGLFAKLPMQVVDTPRGELPRPTTETTLRQLIIDCLNKYEDITDITFVSNQPHVDYQESVTDIVLNIPGAIKDGRELKIEVIGPGFELSPGPDHSKDIKDLVGALGSRLYAKTPKVVAKLNLDVKDPAVKQKFVSLFEKQQLILQNARSVLKL